MTCRDNRVEIIFRSGIFSEIEVKSEKKNYLQVKDQKETQNRSITTRAETESCKKKERKTR